MDALLHSITSDHISGFQERGRTHGRLKGDRCQDLPEGWGASHETFGRELIGILDFQTGSCLSWRGVDHCLTSIELQNTVATLGVQEGGGDQGTEWQGPGIQFGRASQS